MDCEDYATFLKDVYHENGDLVFQKNYDYRILSEDEKNYYISPFNKGNECSQIPKKEEGELFEVV